MKTSHFAFGALIAATALALPERALAADDPPSIISYGSNGFWTGAQLGLATGYLATGKDYERSEWRKLVFGAGVGALSGVAIGITLGIVDSGSTPPATGWLVLRDAGYGIGLGALVGLATGALFMLDSPDTKYLVRGIAIGSLVGAGVGVVVGVIQGVRSEPAAPLPAAQPPAAASSGVSWRLGVASVGALREVGFESETSLPTLLPAIEGTF
jgi:hypothetical protein